MQQETALYKTLKEKAEDKAISLEQDLYDIREKVVEVTQKFDKGQKKKKKREKWQGSEDVEKLCAALTGYLTSPMNNPLDV